MQNYACAFAQSIQHCAVSSAVALSVASHQHLRYLEHSHVLILKTIEIEKEIVREVVRGDKHNLRKSANRTAQISVIHSAHCTDLCFAICRFSQVVFVTSNNFTHNLLFYFNSF